MTDDELYQGYFEKVYQHTNVQQHYSFQESEELAQSGICVTYGELLYPSVKKMIQRMNLTDKDVFLDLGSGGGKCALQVFMQTEAAKVIGIEAAPQLHNLAFQSASQMKTDFPFFWEGGRDCLFLQANFLQVSWDEVTTIYTCSTCFSDALLVAISEKINQTKNIKKVFSLRPLPTLKIPLIDVFQVECSWDSALCFFYSN